MPKTALKLVDKMTDDELDAVQKEIDAKTKADALAIAKASRTGDILPPIEAHTYDDLSNARRFIAEFGLDVLYLAEAKKWLYWDATHWRFDQANFVYDLACEFVTDLYGPDNAKDADSFKHAKRSNNASGIDAMLKIVRNKKTVTADELDQQPDLFNCLSGTIDLPTGEILTHDRNHLITKLSPFHYNEDATADRFDMFLSEIQPNENIRNYLQQALGYSMTASYTDRAFFILYGFGRNGKSVFVDLFSRIFGNYSQNTTAESLMKKKFGGSIPNDIARLRGSRFITCSETEEGGQLNESLIKAMTGGDSMTARFLFGEFFDFYFSGKLWIITNHRPKIFDTSHGFWDRLKLIPFTTQIPKDKQIDKDRLLNILLAEASGILAWLVSGFQKYYEGRQLVEPPEISAEIENYKFEQDSIAQFISECCETYSDDSEWSSHMFKAKNPEVYAAYKAFCAENGEKVRSQRRLSQNLTERGFTQQPENGTRTWDGFRLNEVNM